jgi:hypothetical protein
MLKLAHSIECRMGHRLYFDPKKDVLPSGSREAIRITANAAIRKGQACLECWRNSAAFGVTLGQKARNHKKNIQIGDAEYILFGLNIHACMYIQHRRFRV